MKALSVKQPWAHLIARAEKTIELRRWQTDYRGALLICARKRVKNAWVDYRQENRRHVLPAGVMMCVVDWVDVRKADNNYKNRQQACVDYIAPGIFGWVLHNPRDALLKPVRGKLRLFDVDDGLIEYMADDDWFAHSDKIAWSGADFAKADDVIIYRQ